MTPAGMVYNGKWATDQAQRRGVKRSAGPDTGLFYPHLRATELGMRVDPVLNIHAPQFALHSPGPHTRDDPSRHGVQWKVCNSFQQSPYCLVCVQAGITPSVSGLPYVQEESYHDSQTVQPKGCFE